jgi:nitrogen-specific signal transduction histidine kinase/ActR/RegA family two-component response regulator
MVTATAVKDEQELIVAYRGIIRDNTSYKQLQRQLIQSQKMESIGTLSGGIAHDFNNVLAVVLSTAELIRKRTTHNEDLAELTQMIINAAMRGRSITQQLLLFSRSDNPILRPVALHEIISENVKLLEHSFPKSIAVQVHTLNEDDTIMADISHLHQIILNLAINARDAMPNGGTLTMVVDRVSANDILKKWSDAEEKDYIAIYISDTGTGIPSELHTRIFDPFFTTKVQGKGTGLGLSIVHGIVKNHHGYIELDSQPGLGATFRLYFPANDDSKSVEDPLMHEIKTYSGTETILIVDDEPALVQLLSDILNMSGYQVLSAKNGVEAIRVYHENADVIQLVISDIGMPEMDGIQLFQHLKEIRPDLPVIVATGYMGDTTSHNLLTKGIADIIFKPYSVADILKTIRKTLDTPRKQS